jgi:hypothetical protein
MSSKRGQGDVLRRNEAVTVYLHNEAQLIQVYGLIIVSYDVTIGHTWSCGEKYRVDYWTQGMSDVEQFMAKD